MNLCEEYHYFVDCVLFVLRILTDSFCVCVCVCAGV